MNMVVLTEDDIKILEHNYYWHINTRWSPFPTELKMLLLEEFGNEPYPYERSLDDLYVGTIKMITDYFTENE